MCQLTKDLYSDNGETLLARRGAMLMGEQNKVMTQGVVRVFVNWTNLKDGNVNVKIGALGTDGLGASGCQPGLIIIYSRDIQVRLCCHCLVMVWIF
ncbi:Type IV secretion system protein virB10 (plasmid) [Salmonella enterica subsp. enterica]|nr:TrbI/VirB10 family protein [Salmonella enterica]ARV71187.1 Type IV secretion system protein virB10 [Salmonella enterica subsp. enterica]